MLSTAHVTETMDKAVARRKLLDHPFYKAWAAGTLTTEDLSFYAAQYWNQVKAFPGYLESLEARLPEGAARATVRENLADERDGDHPGLWLRFAAALGTTSVAVDAAATSPETERCVAAFDSAARGASLPFALGMLYGYESQTPEVATTKVAGLREHYGIDGPPVAYFELHGELDVEHSRALADAITAVATDDSAAAEAEAGAAAGTAAIWELLDGVARVRGIG